MAGLLILAQLGGGTPGSKGAEQIQQSSRRSLAPPPAPSPTPPGSVWVPDRWAEIPGQTGHVMVPGHWEQQVGPRDYYVPPLTVCDPGSGACATVPAGVRPPAETRQGP